MSESIRGRIADIERQLRVGNPLPASFDPAWFEGLPPGPITEPPPGVVLTPAQRETFDLVAAMDNSIPDCDE